MNMGDHIYPECPNCGEVPEEGKGVALSDMEPRGSNWAHFKWRCPSCLLTMTGLWNPRRAEPLWWDSDRRLVDVIRIALRRLYKSIGL